MKRRPPSWHKHGDGQRTMTLANEHISATVEIKGEVQRPHGLFARALFESHDWISRIMQDKWFLLPANQTGASRHLAQAPPAISLFLLLPAGKESYLFPFPLSKLRLRQLQLFHALSHIWSLQLWPSNGLCVLKFLIYDLWSSPTQESKNLGSTLGYFSYL